VGAIVGFDGDGVIFGGGTEDLGHVVEVDAEGDGAAEVSERRKISAIAVWVGSMASREKPAREKLKFAQFTDISFMASTMCFRTEPCTRRASTIFFLP